MLVGRAVKDFKPYNEDFANEPHNSNEHKTRMEEADA
jgi:hypothetical protein